MADTLRREGNTLSAKMTGENRALLDHQLRPAVLVDRCRREEAATTCSVRGD
jgi:hypothetical protein